MNKGGYILQQILDESPPHLNVWVRLHDEISDRIHYLMNLKGISFAHKQVVCDGYPETYNYLLYHSDLTLKSLAKIEIELGGPIIKIIENENHKTVC